MSIQAHKFISLLGKTTQRDARALAELEKLAEAYPASHIVQGVLASVLKQEGNFDYTHRLRMAAITSPSRFALFRYLEENETANKTALTYEFEMETHEPVKQHAVKTIMVPVEEEPVGEEPTYVVEKINAEETPFVIPSIQSLSHNHDESVHAEENSLLQQIVAGSIPLEEEKKEFTFMPETEISSISADQMDAIKNDPLEREIFSDAINRTIQHEVFQDALDIKSEFKIEDEVETGDEASGFSYWLDPGKSKSNKRDDKMKRIDKLIENFIKNEPKIKPKKVPFFEPIQAARDSVKYDENLASEPLARIFEKQGFFERAIQIYEKLMMKFPEKKVYFAGRIEKVQEVIKNIKNKQ